jgi:Mrp family chromosome partitioning ATPase/LPS O-antigen subunit length determinant protein (WzzB/FepE family)
VNHDQIQTADWLLPGEEQLGIRRYAQTIRERFKLIALTVLVTTLAAALYVGTAQKTYKAEADILVSPVAGTDTTLNGIPGLIHASSDPTRDVQTASRLVTTIDVARTAREKLNTDRTARSLLKDIKADPVAGSNVIAVTATASTAQSAQNLANVFAAAAIEDRTGKFHDQLDAAIKALKPQVDSLPKDAPGAAPNPLRTQLSELETLRAGSDPTFRVETQADKPTAAAWPKRNVSILAGIFAGLALGIGGAFAAQVFDPRLRREDQLRALYRLPVLARIPEESRARSDNAIAPHQLSPAGVEAFRTLRATLTAPRPAGGQIRSVMITGASPSEGKTTTALNLAASLALAGKRVVLIEADLRRPKIGKALGISATRGIASVLIDGLPLNEALLTSEAYGENLKLLLVDRAGEWMADQFSLPAAKGLVDEAKEIADYVIIDSPPLAEVIDALPLVQMTDDVVLVVRLGRTHLNKLTRLGEILARYGIRPAGFAVVGVSPTTEYGYYTERPVRTADERRTPVLSR